MTTFVDDEELKKLQEKRASQLQQTAHVQGQNAKKHKPNTNVKNINAPPTPPVGIINNILTTIAGQNYNDNVKPENVTIKTFSPQPYSFRDLINQLLKNLQMQFQYLKKEYKEEDAESYTKEFIACLWELKAYKYIDMFLEDAEIQITVNPKTLVYLNTVAYFTNPADLQAQYQVFLGLANVAQ